jgi:pyrimidine-specific ribonucleoside hydrolase
MRVIIFSTARIKFIINNNKILMTRLNMKIWVRLLGGLMFVLSLQGALANSREFIIDTDMSIDDAIAILYLTQARTVKAITIAGTGEAHCKPALANLAGLLHLVKKSIPYACGRASPLSGNHRFIDPVRAQADNLLNTTDLLPSSKKIPAQSAVNLLVSTLQQTKQPIDILAIGPLTNIAEMLKLHPELKKSIHRIYIMGGAVHVAGNLPLADSEQKNVAAEWNIYIDPLAADIVFRSGIAITLVPLDITNQLPITNAFYYKIQHKQASEASKYVYQLLTRNQKILLNNDWYFWDPLAAVIAADDSIASTKIENLRIVLTPEIISGTTAIDDRHGNPVSVCYAVNKVKFEKRLLRL